jgi:hypothetical protein
LELAVVTEYEIPHFKIVLEGRYAFTKALEEQQGTSRRSVWLHPLGSDDSISIVIPGQGPIRRRRCTHSGEHELRAWFAVSEALAWAYANAYGKNRPNKTGQTITDEYAISY